MTMIDFAWLEALAETAGAKVEVDREGSVIVSPAANEHVVAANRLSNVLFLQLPDDLDVLVEGPRWAPVGLTGPNYVPDLTVVTNAALRSSGTDYQLDPPPLLVVEVLSPATRRRDLSDKAQDYYLGGAQAYWTLEVPGIAAVTRPTVSCRLRGPDGWSAPTQHAGVVTWPAGELFPMSVTIDLDTLAL